MRKRRAHFICPVRNASEEVQLEIDNYEKKLLEDGWEVHNPKYAVDQSDRTGYNICVAHRESMKNADMVFLFWDPSSSGSHFDLGMAFAMEKPLTLVKCYVDDVENKSYLKVIEEVIWNQKWDKPKVYLAGPIKDCTDIEAGGWRQMVAEKLNKMGFEILDPFIRDYRGIEENHWQDIVNDDKKDIANSDYIIANCIKPSAGTSMEIYLAWASNKKAIVVAPRPVSPWIKYHAQVVVDTLDEAINYLIELNDAKTERFNAK